MPNFDLAGHLDPWALTTHVRALLRELPVGVVFTLQPNHADSYPHINHIYKMILTYHVYYSTILRLGLVAILCVLGAAAALDMIRHHPADSHSIKTLISQYTIILMLNTLARLLWLRRLRQSKNCGKVRASNLIMFHYKDALIVHDIANPKSQSLTTLEEKTGIVGRCISTGNLRPILRYFVRVLTHLASYTPGPVQLIEHIGLTNDVLF